MQKKTTSLATAMVAFALFTLFSVPAHASFATWLGLANDPTPTTAQCAQCGKGDIAKKKAAIGDAKKKVDELKKQLADAQKDFKVAQAAGDTDEMIRINRRIAGLKRTFNKFVKDTNTRLGGLQKEIDETGKDLGERIDGVDKRLSTMNKDLTEAIGALQDKDDEHDAQFKVVQGNVNGLGEVVGNHEKRLNELENDRQYRLVTGVGYNSGWTDVSTGVGGSAMELQLGAQWMKRGSYLGLQFVGQLDRVFGTFGVPGRVAAGGHFDAVLRVDRMLTPNLPLVFAPTIGYLGVMVSPNGPGTAAVMTNGVRLGVQTGTETFQLFGAWSNNDGGTGENYSVGLLGVF